MITTTSAEAQSHFGKLLDNVQREPVAITRRGRPVAFILSPNDINELIEGTRKRSQAATDYEAYCAMASKLATPAAAKLTDEDVNRLVHESR